MSNMTIRNKIVAGALASSMLGLAACGGGGSGTQDVGDKSPQASSRTFYARAVDGYLAGSTVYVDLNENFKLDAFEPRAITDNEGYFSYNHHTGTDYCATSALAQYCLRGNVGANEEVVIRVTGGYDTITKLPFEGVLSLRSSDLDRDDLRLVTPGTSMVADDATDAAIQAKLQALMDAGIFESGGSLHDDPSEQLAITRAQVAAIISQMVGEAGKQAYPATFTDVQEAGWAQAYTAMSAGLVEGVGQGNFGSIGEVFSDAAKLAEVARLAVYAAMNAGQVAPSSYVLPNSTSLASLFESTADLVGLNDKMIEALQGSASPQQLAAILRAQAVMAERVFANPKDPEVTDLKAWIENQLAQGDGLGSDLTALGGDNIDVSALAASNFDFDPMSNSISASVTIPAEAATAFAALANTSFGVSMNKPGEQGAAVLFVSGAAGARSGDIDVCVRYRGDEDFDTTSSSDPNGAMLIAGRWSLLDDHTLTLSIDIVGGVRSLLLKAVSAGGGIDTRGYRFDFGGDLSEWSGSAPSGFTAGAVPTSDAGCKDALVQRFGPMT
jgi:hypothetical protein